MKSCDLSVIIPTKDRYLCLIELIECLKMFQSDRVEFIIQDNSSENSEFLKFISEVSDSRIKYYYTKENLSGIANFDKAVSNSSGKYVCLIGDDDSILENIIDMVDLMIFQGVDCLIQEQVTYYWPDVNFKYSNKIQKPASYIIKKRINKHITKINVEQELNRVIESGGTIIGRLPRLYHGIVTRAILNKVFNSCNTFFPGPSPDMASSVALTVFSENCYHINLPFTISGKSATSTSGMGLAHTHVGELEKLHFLPKNILQNWDPKIPQFWSCSTIWAQSLFCAMRECKIDRQLNYIELYAHLLVFERGYSHCIKDKIALMRLSLAQTVVFRIRVSIIFLKRGINFLRRKLFSDSNKQTICNITSIQNCYNSVNNFLKRI